MLRNFFVIVASISTSVLTMQCDAFAFTINSWKSNQFTDTIAGIDNFIIEDFEDVNLVAGLTVKWNNPDSEPVSILSSLYQPSDEGFSGNPWDGIYALNNNRQQRFFPSKKTSETTTFYFQGGADSIGLGISNYEHSGGIIYVNDVEFITLDELNATKGATFKSIYIRLDAEENETISSITIKGQPFNSVDDFLIFDHLAISRSVNTVPEPLTILGSGTAIAFGTGFKRTLGKAKKKYKQGGFE